MFVSSWPNFVNVCANRRSLRAPHHLPSGNQKRFQRDPVKRAGHGKKVATISQRLNVHEGRHKLSQGCAELSAFRKRDRFEDASSCCAGRARPASCATRSARCEGYHEFMISWRRHVKQNLSNHTMIPRGQECMAIHNPRRARHPHESRASNKRKSYMKTNSKWKWLLLLSVVMGVGGCTDYYGTYQAYGRPYYGGYGAYGYSQPAYGYGYPYAGYGYSSGYGYPYAGYGYSSGYGYPYAGYGYSSGYGYRYGNQGYRYRSSNQGYYGNNQGYRYRSNQGYYRSNQGYRYGGNRGYRYRNHRIQEERSLPRRRGE